MHLPARHLDMALDDRGEGLPVLFVHAFPLGRAMWRPQLDGLTDRCRCVAPDLRGFGESSVRGPYGMDAYADDLAALLDALAIDKAVVVGLSMGGYVAFALWRRHRTRVRAFVLADTRAGADPVESRGRREALIALARSRGASAVAEAQLQGLLGKTTRKTRPELVRVVHAIAAAAPVEGIVGALGALLARPDSTPTLATIDVPTMIVVGAEDVLTPADDARALHAGIRGSTLEVIAGAGHLSNYERPAAFNHLLTEFVAGLASA